MGSGTTRPSPHPQGCGRSDRCDRRRRPPRSKPSVTYGRYRLEVRSPDGNRPRRQRRLQRGLVHDGQRIRQPRDARRRPRPRQLQAGRYREAPHCDQARRQGAVAVLSGGLMSHAGGRRPQRTAARSSVAVGEDWGAGAYVTAMLYRPLERRPKRMPSRAIGVQWIGARSVRAHAEGRARRYRRRSSRDTTLTVPVKIARPERRRGGARHARRRRRRHPQSHALTRRRRPKAGSTPSAARPRDPRLLWPPDRRHAGGARHAPHRRRRRRRRHPGHPAGRGTRSRCSPASSRVDADGTAKVDFDMPDFNGTVRVMAVAWSGDKLGHAPKRRHRARPRGAHGLRAALPDTRRRGAPRDRRAQRRRTARQPTSSSGQRRSRRPSPSAPLDLKAGERTRRARSSEANRASGRSTYDVHVTGPDGIAVERHLTFDVKPPAGDIKRTTVSGAQGRGGNITLSTRPGGRHDRLAHARSTSASARRRPWTCPAC